jgi:hypothetical protein
MFQAFSAALRILFWFLKRKKARSYGDWKEDIKEVNSAIAKGDDDALSLAFDKLRVEAKRHNSKLKGVGMPRGHQRKL